MENTDSIDAVNSSWLSPSFRKPLYSSFSFENIPNTVLSLFGLNYQGMVLPPSVFSGLSRQWNKIIVVLLDGFGWRFLERHTDKVKLNTLIHLRKEGVTSKLTSLFPSTTACSVSLMFSGLPLSQSGVVEWYYYEPLYDMCISPLLFCHPGEKEKGTLLRDEVDPERLFVPGDFVSKLTRNGIEAYTVQPTDYRQSPYNKAIWRGTSVGYNSTSEAFEQIVKLATKTSAPQYIYSYFPLFDSAMHEHGVCSPQADQEAYSFFEQFESHLLTKLRGSVRDTLLLFFADHGQTATNPETTIYFDRECPEILSCLKRSRKGDVIAPCGSSRDYFLHVEPKYIDKVFSLLAERLEGKAEVYLTETLISKGLYGAKEVCPATRAKLGDIVVLSYTGESFFYLGERQQFRKKHLGNHGGLTPDETDIPFIAYPVE